MAQHISIRVPWHDHGWDGTICQDPAGNNSCLRLKNIYENRDDACKYRWLRAHCTEFRCIPSARSVHAFRKAEQSFVLLDYERSYLKSCVNVAFMPPEAMPLTQFLSI